MEAEKLAEEKRKIEEAERIEFEKRQREQEIIDEQKRKEEEQRLLAEQAKQKESEEARIHKIIEKDAEYQKAMALLNETQRKNQETLDSVNSSIAKIGDTLKTIRETSGAMDNFKNGKPTSLLFNQPKYKKNGKKFSRKSLIIWLEK